MHARRTKISGSPERIEQAKQVIESNVIPAANELPGFRGGYWLIDRATGEGITFTFFDTKENLQGTADAATHIRGDATREIGADITSVDEFEVVLDTGPKSITQHHTRGSSNLRVIRSASMK